MSVQTETIEEDRFPHGGGSVAWKTLSALPTIFDPSNKPSEKELPLLVQNFLEQQKTFWGLRQTWADVNPETVSKVVEADSEFQHDNRSIHGPVPASSLVEAARSDFLHSRMLLLTTQAARLVSREERIPPELINELKALSKDVHVPQRPCAPRQNLPKLKARVPRGQRLEQRIQFLRSIVNPQNARVVNHSVCFPHEIRKRANLELRILSFALFQKDLRQRIFSKSAQNRFNPDSLLKYLLKNQFDDDNVGRTTATGGSTDNNSNGKEDCVMVESHKDPQQIPALEYGETASTNSTAPSVRVKHRDRSSTTAKSTRQVPIAGATAGAESAPVKASKYSNSKGYFNSSCMPLTRHTWHYLSAAQREQALEDALLFRSTTCSSGTDSHKYGGTVQPSTSSKGSNSNCTDNLFKGVDIPHQLQTRNRIEPFSTAASDYCFPLASRARNELSFGLQHAIADATRLRLGNTGINELLRVQLKKICLAVPLQRRRINKRRAAIVSTKLALAKDAQKFFEIVSSRLKALREREMHDRMRMLKENDFESYRLMVRKTKNQRLTELLDQTDSFLETLGDRVNRQKVSNRRIARQQKQDVTRHQNTTSDKKIVPDAQPQQQAHVDSSTAAATNGVARKIDGPNTATSGGAEMPSALGGSVEGATAAAIPHVATHSVDMNATVGSATTKPQLDEGGIAEDSSALCMDPVTRTAEAVTTTAIPVTVSGDGISEVENDVDEGGVGVGSTKAGYYDQAHDISEEVKQPSLMTGGTLMPYQLLGLEFMVSLYNNSLSGILADEMGLGKTIQTIALIAFLHEHKSNPGPHLVVVPLSTLPNWTNEFEKWCPSLGVLEYRGSKLERRSLSQRIRKRNFHVCITTFDFVIRDKAILSTLQWKHIIVDEGHRMKNAKSKFHVTLHAFKSTHRLLLTGTPLQNNLTELWSLLNFLLPDIFASMTDFERWFEEPFKNMAVESNDAAAVALTGEEQLLIFNRLHAVLRPFLLRRIKADVINDLPDKREFVIRIHLSKWQTVAYQKISDKAFKVQDSTGKIALKSVNNIMMQLRKVANHPYLFLDEYYIDENIYRVSGKFEVLDRMLPKLLRFGHKMLIFCQMTKLMDILAEYLDFRSIPHFRLDGSISLADRRQRMDDFNDPASCTSIFMLSTRAGGLGLNLQAADTVILFDSDWNPHQDLQAQARAHRIGQKREVRVFRLVTICGVEEAILSKANFKLGIDEKVIQAGMFNTSFSDTARDEKLRTLLVCNDNLNVDVCVTTPHELNRYMARSEAEEAWFDSYDRDLFGVHPHYNALSGKYSLNTDKVVDNEDDDEDMDAASLAETDALLVGSSPNSSAGSSASGAVAPATKNVFTGGSTADTDSFKPSPTNSQRPKRFSEKRKLAPPVHVASSATPSSSRRLTRRTAALMEAAHTTDVDVGDAQQLDGVSAVGGDEDEGTAGSTSTNGVGVLNADADRKAKLGQQIESLLIESGRLIRLDEIPEELVAEEEEDADDNLERKHRRTRVTTLAGGEDLTEAAFLRAVEKFESGLVTSFETALQDERTAASRRAERRAARAGVADKRCKSEEANLEAEDDDDDEEDDDDDVDDDDEEEEESYKEMVEDEEETRNESVKNDAKEAGGESEQQGDDDVVEVDEETKRPVVTEKGRRRRPSTSRARPASARTAKRGAASKSEGMAGEEEGLGQNESAQKSQDAKVVSESKDDGNDVGRGATTHRRKRTIRATVKDTTGNVTEAIMADTSNKEISLGKGLSATAETSITKIQVDKIGKIAETGRSQTDTLGRKRRKIGPNLVSSESREESKETVATSTVTVSRRKK